MVATADGRWSFVTLNSAVEVLSNRARVPIAGKQVSVPGTPQGEQLTHDGRYLLVADGSGALVIDVARAESGEAGAVMGGLSSPSGRGATEVALSPDDRFAFVTLEISDSLAVFDLRKALTGGFGPRRFRGDGATWHWPGGARRVTGRALDLCHQPDWQGVALLCGRAGGLSARPVEKA